MGANVPHEWLFSQCACIVNHGGVGTVSAAIRSQVPTIVTPVWNDQYDTSHIVNELGVGIGFTKQFQKINAHELGEAIQTCVGNVTIAKKAMEVGKQMCAEPGVQAIVAAVETFWREYVETGAYKDFVEERRQKSKQ